MRLFAVSLSVLALALPCRAADADPTKPGDVFGMTKVWTMHLTVPAKEWEKMQPARGGFSREKGKMPQLSDERKLRGGFRYDFEYVKGDLEIDGKKLPDVGIRFKGNSSYLLTANHLKRPFKIDLDRYDGEQTWHGLRKLTLNNNVMDPTAARETLAYAVYRAAGVPAPRTAYAQLSLTVPGKYDKVLVGLYTLIETVDKTFLEGRFGVGKGMLLKPEHVGPLDYLGEKWEAYAERYRPKSRPATKEQRRLIEFITLVQQADEARFNAQIASYLDIDRFLRYVAATVALASIDSFVGFGHNYYLYLHPKTHKFIFLPWDLDHSFGALTMVGSADDLMNLSVRKPCFGRNKLIERLFADERHYGAYKSHLAKLLEGPFTTAGVKRDLETITKALAPFKEKEKKALAVRGDWWNGWKVLGAFNSPPDLEKFMAKRTASLADQLAGKSEGKEVRPGGGFFAGRPGVPGGADRTLVQPILKAADTNKDGKLSRAEVAEAARALFAACDKQGKGAIDQRALTAGLEGLVPKQPGGGAPAGFPGPPSLAIPLARAIFGKAAKDGKLTADGLVEVAQKLFEAADRDKDGALEAGEITAAIRELFTPAKPALVDKTKKG